MLKKKALSCMLIVVMMFTFMPLTTGSVFASSDGSKVLVKEKTITIKPGKTYKTPKFKLSKKMAFQVPIDIWLSPKDKGKPGYIKSGKYALTLKNAKGKTIDSFKDSLKGVGKKNADKYSDWIYFTRGKSYTKNVCFAKGKYFFTIKNTTKRTIKVRYSVKGYTKFASKANLKSKVTADSGDYVYVGKIGPGIPFITDVYYDDSEGVVDLNYRVAANGKTYLRAIGQGQTAVEISLAGSSKTYVVTMTVR